MNLNFQFSNTGFTSIGPSLDAMYYHQNNSVSLEPEQDFNYFIQNYVQVNEATELASNNHSDLQSTIASSHTNKPKKRVHKDCKFCLFFHGRLFYFKIYND